MRPTPADALSDAELRSQWESCELPIECWTHRSHLRVAYTLVRALGLQDAIPRMRTGIQRFNAWHDVPESLEAGYHETLTQAWLHIIARLIETHGAEANSVAFLNRHDYLDRKFLLRMFYTRDRIMSEQAKHSFVSPDVATWDLSR